MAVSRSVRTVILRWYWWSLSRWVFRSRIALEEGERVSVGLTWVLVGWELDVKGGVRCVLVLRRDAAWRVAHGYGIREGFRPVLGSVGPVGMGIGIGRSSAEGVLSRSHEARTRRRSGEALMRERTL